MFRLPFLIAGLIIPFICLSQQPLYEYSRWIKVEDGLPQSFISGLQQDKDGFLWIGTRDGLARYDGKNYRVFRHILNDSLGLRSNVITDLFLDHENLLWVFYVNEKVDCFDPAKLQVCYKDSFKTVRQLYASLKTKKFWRDRGGKFWFCTSKQGAVCYDPSANKITRFDSARNNLQSNNCIGLAETRNRTLFAITGKGIEILESTTGEKKYVVPFDPSLNFRYSSSLNYLITTMPDGKIAIGYSNRLIFFDPTSKKFIPAHIFLQQLSPEGIIQHMQVGNDGYLYISAGGGVFRLEKDYRFTWIWQSKNKNSFATDCRSFLIDQSSVIWFGTNTAGIAKIDLQSLPFQTGIYKTNFTTDVLSYWPGTITNIPSLFLNGKWAYTLRTCYDGFNRLWITCNEKENADIPIQLYAVDGNVFRKIPVPAGNYPVIKGLSIADNGDMWAVDLRGNFWKWKGIAALPEFIPSILKLDAATAVIDLETDGETFWVSTDKEGLFKISNNEVVKKFSTSSTRDWPGNQMADLSKDPSNKNILWAGTLGNGLIRINMHDDVFSVITTENQLPNNTIYSIVPDKEGNLWISTNNGLTRFSYSSGDILNFDIKDGLAGNEFNRFHHLRFPDGRIAFGGPEGYTLFDPALFKQDNFQTPVKLTGLLINNKRVDYVEGSPLLPEPLNEVEKLVLPYNKNFVQVEFAGLQFNQPGKIRYRYMLVGYDKEWIESNYNVAGYTRLPPGRYTLLLNASNSSGNWSSNIKKLAIRIKPPLWATWWAYTIYASLGLLLIVLYGRYRSNRIRLQNQVVLEHGKAMQLKELDALKDKFFSNITHELRTPLTLIMTPIEKLSKQTAYSQADQKVLTTAYKNAEHLLRLINQLLDISKIESGQMQVNEKVGDLAELIELSVQQFSEQAKQKNIELFFVNDHVSGLYFFDADKWEKIIFNLLSNAIKFTPENGTVSITISSPVADPLNTVSLIVADSGKGMNASDREKIFDRFFTAGDGEPTATQGTGIGLSLVRDLVNLMKGKIEVKSEPGKGSRFTVTIPVEKKSSFRSPRVPVSANQPGRGATELNKEKPIVLVVEDNQDLLAFIADSLDQNWQALKAGNGKQAWDLILSELPDLVISDLMMPGLNGYELCAKVKEDPRTSHIGFILLTARAAQENKLTGLKKGADDYLTKPFHFEELEQRLHNLNEQQKRLRTHIQQELLQKPQLEKLPHISDVFISNLYRQLDEHIDDPAMSVEFLAQLANMSQRTLNRKLKALLNITPVEFIRYYRLQKAAVLISSGKTISDTAYSVGFETVSYFSQCFKEQFGKTPSEFAAQKTA